MTLSLGLLILIVLLSNAVEAVAGFGSTILALTFGSHLYPIPELVPIFLPIGYLLSLSIVSRNRHSVDWRTLVRQILPLCGLGLPVGLFVFETMRSRTLEIGFGVFVIVLSLFQLWQLRRNAGEPLPPLKKVPAAIWLFAGGVVQGAYTTGGPMLVYYASRNMPDKHNFRATLSAVWLLLNTIIISSHVYHGNINLSTLTQSASLLPGLLGGLVIGEWAHRRIPERTFRVMVFVLLVIAGIALLARA